MLSLEQHANRQVALGGSDCAAALGLSKWKTAYQLYLEKRGEAQRSDEETEYMWWGRMLEPVVRQRYAEVTNRVVRQPQGTIFHPEHDFMCAHIDGFTDCQRGYEGKTAMFMTEDWGDEGTDQIPDDYLMQTHHYMIVTKFPVFDVAALIGRQFKIYEVLPDKELHEQIIEGEREFMRRVREGDPPPLDYEHKTAIDLLRKLYPGTNGQRIKATEDACAWRERMQKAGELEKDAKATKDAFKARLLEFMGPNALLEFPDGKCFRRQETERAGYTVQATKYVDARFVNDPLAKGAKRK